eukprot:g3885.t1
MKGGSNVRVAVRVRPFLPREIERGAHTCFEIEGPATTLIKPDDQDVAGPARRTFTFDFSYNSFVPAGHADHASQETVWEDMGSAVLDAAWEGYNVSLFAYGQTGSGKSYSMMGYGEDRGIIPRAVTHIFQRIESNTDPDLSFTVECSMLEIYNERIRDLFDAASRVRGGGAAVQRPVELRVRDHPRTGPYVEGLRSFAVQTFEQVNALMERGAQARTIAATNMNASSSRAHTIFTVKLSQRQQQHDEKIKKIAKATEKSSTINLIDLAGSERADSTGATGDRLKEGAAINQSLSALGNVINALAKQANRDAKASRARKTAKSRALDSLAGANDGLDPRASTRVREVIPYRNSVLTHLLKSALGGNAKTIMIAAISPAAINFSESLSTLRYADRAKQIRNKAVINEDPNARLIRELKEEIARLKAAHLEQAGAAGAAAASEAERQRMEVEKEAAIAEMRRQMEAQAAEMEQWKREHQHGAGEQVEPAEVGAAADAAAEGTGPMLVNVNEDPALSGVLKHLIPAGRALRVGKRAPQLQKEPPDIVLGGLGIQPMHAKITHTEGGEVAAGELELELASFNAKIFVNGQQLQMAQGKCRLRHNDRVLFGNSCAFRVAFVADAAGADTAFAAARASGGGGAERDNLRPPSELTVDWEFMNAELNRDALSALGGGKQSTEESEAAKAEKAAMAAKLAAMERKLQEAHMNAKDELLRQRSAWEAQHKGADDAARRAQEEALRARQDELERKLQAQIDESRRLEERRDRRRLEQQILEEKMLKLLPLVAEANAMAEELQRVIYFAVKLVSRPTASGRDMATDVAVRITFERPQAGAAGDGGVEVGAAVEEHPAWAERAVGKGTAWLWSHAKFMDRLFLMRDLYQRWGEPAPQGFSGDVAQLAVGVGPDADPFWDPPADEALGTARIELEAVSYCMSIGEDEEDDGGAAGGGGGGAGEWFPLADTTRGGRHVGEVRVSVAPTLLGQGPPLDEFDELGDEALRGRQLDLHVTVAHARGLDPAFSRFKSAYLRIDSLGSETLCEAGAAKADGGEAAPALRSPCAELTSVHQHVVSFSTHLQRVITPELVEALTSGALQLSLWGSFEVAGVDGSSAGDGASMGGTANAPGAVGQGVGGGGGGRERCSAAGDGRTREELLRELLHLRQALHILRETVPGGAALVQLSNLGSRVQPTDANDETWGPKEATGMSAHTWSDKLYYRGDTVIGTKKGQIFMLVLVWLVMVIIGGATLSATALWGPDGCTGDPETAEGACTRGTMTVWEGMWQAWTFMADPGTHAGVVDDLLGRIVAMVITWFGIFFFAVFIGFVVDAILVKMDNLKKGKSDVVEHDHTVMLGWTSFSVAFILEIAEANSSEGGGVVVVLAEREKQELEAEFQQQVKKKQLMGTKVVFRMGSPMHTTDLLKVSCHTARAVLVLASMPSDDMRDTFSPDKADAATLRTVLSLSGIEQGMRGHIVAEVLDIDNEPLVRMVGQKGIETLVSHDVIGRLMLMSARQPGLARVYTEILGFDGDEFYMKAWPELEGVQFGDVMERMMDATPIGIYRDGQVMLNPATSVTLKATDEVIVIAEDDDTYEVAEPVDIVVGKNPEYQLPTPEAENILMTGWRRDIRDIFMLLDSLVVMGTKVHVLAETAVDDRIQELIAVGLTDDVLRNIKIVHHVGNSASRKRLEMLPMNTFTSVMILADEASETDVMHSDSHALATLLLVRDIQRTAGTPAATPGRSSFHAKSVTTSVSRVPCICEILDSRTQKTISSNKTIAQSSDFVQSNEMISQILAMIAENRAVKHILDELLGSTGSDLCVIESERYAEPHEQLSYFQLAKRAQIFGEVLCGYQDENTYINPRNKAEVREWGGIFLVVLRRPEDAQKHLAAMRALMPNPERSRRRMSVATFSAETEIRFKDLDGKINHIIQQMDRMQGREGAPAAVGL